MKRILLTLGLLLLSSCGIYNLEIKLSNPLANINVFDGFADKEAGSARQYQCQIEIDEEEWESAVTTCAALPVTDENKALYASAVHGQVGGDLFAIIEAAEDSDSVIKGYTNTIEGTTQTLIDALTTRIAALKTIADAGGDDDYEFQLSIMYFTSACARIRKAANTANSNSDGDIVAADINAMTDGEFVLAYSDIHDSQTYMTNAQVTGSVLSDLSSAITDLAADKTAWGLVSLVNKKIAVINLFGL